MSHDYLLMDIIGHLLLHPCGLKPIIVTSFLHILLLPSFMYYNMLEWGLKHSWNSVCVCVCVWFLKEEMKESKHVLGSRLLLHEMRTTTRGWRT
jgi:hypothetical protein